MIQVKPLFLKNIFTLLGFIIICFTTPQNANGQKIAINEVMALNSKSIADEDGDFEDWIELYNFGDQPVNLKDFGLSDNYSNPFKWVFPSVTIQPHDYLLVWASGKDRKPEIAEYTPGILRQVYTNMQGSSINDLINHADFPNNPTEEYLVTDYFEAPSNIGDHYGQRMHGYILAPLTGNYIFWIASDDNGSLRLSHNAMPGNAVEIARVPGWTSSREWNKYPEQKSDDIYLEAGKYYYISALMKEHEGGDNLAVRWQLPNGTIEEPIPAPRVFWRDKQLHSNFSISADGEEILLTNPSGERLDELEPTTIPTDISYGRYPNGTGDWFYYSDPTPGEANHDKGLDELLNPPTFSHIGGFYESSFDLTISSLDGDAIIIYTLDGSEPDPDNIDGTTYRYKNLYPGGGFLTNTFQTHKYLGKITITDRSDKEDKFSQMATTYRQDYFPSTTVFKGTSIRARTIKENAVPSEIVTNTYFVTPESFNRYSLPIFSFNTQEDGLFDYEIGIYTPGKILEETGEQNPQGGTNANYWQRGIEWERRASLEFFEPDSKHPVFKQDIGIRLHGGWSRAHSMKSLRLYARGVYGESRFNHKIYPDQPYEEYNRLILRNSGNDYGYTLFRDALMQAIVANLSFDIQNYRPSIVFINSEYWGIHNIRERYDKHYLERVHGVDPDYIDLLTHRNTVKEGSSAHFDNMLNYIESNNIKDEDHYQFIKTQMDIDNFIEYQISNIYFSNTDWPHNNIDFWRHRIPEYEPHAPAHLDGRWRWLLYDTDFGFNLYRTNHDGNTLNHATNQGSGWSTFLLRSLLENESFKIYFINRFADLLNTNFLPENVISVINQMKQMIEPEIDEHIHRWNRPWGKTHWNNEIDKMIEFANERPDYQREHIRSKFGIIDLVDILANVSDKEKGYIKINKLEIKEGTYGITNNPYPWRGTYFQDIPIEFQAVPNPGYSFIRWEGLNEVNNPYTAQEFMTGYAPVTAFFDKADLVHYWHFNNLVDNKLINVEADFSAIGNSYISYSGSGEGYMDRVNDGTSLNALPETNQGYALRVRNPSENRELIMHTPTTGYRNISMNYAVKRTTNGQQAQTLYYRTKPEEEWIRYDKSNIITEDYDLIRYYFTDSLVNDNPDFAVKIVFGGANISGFSGNNRFDNIRVEGVSMLATNISHENNPDKNKYPKPEIYYHQQRIFVYNPYPDEAMVRLFNTQGILVESFTIPNQGLYNFPINQKSGIYIARLIHDMQLFSEKIIIN